MSHSMDKRFSSPHRISSDEHLRCKPRRSILDTNVLVRGTCKSMNLTNPLSGKFNETEVMHSLNDRLAGFIEKVHHLEYQNHLLEREIEEIRGKVKPASRFEEQYGPELRKLRQLVQDITHQKHQIELEHQNLEDELSNLRGLHEREALSKSEAESNIVILKKDISDAYRAKLQLEKKAQALVDEIDLLKSNHEAEVSDMFEKIQDAQETVKVHEFGNPGVTAALRDIRAQLEGHTVSDFQQVGETFRSQFARLTESAETKREALKATQQEIQEYRRCLQAKNIELDCAKGTREALERHLHDVEDRHKEEMIHYQNTIKELENELINCKFDMSGYLREYQDLLNVKMALDVEILSYRKLLCGEEARLSTISDTPISLPYIYHQSPTYTLPCVSRPGDSHRRVEPQYKFVEEIITETTREIEMSEFEEAGFEEVEVEKDEQEHTKRDGGGSEKERDNKDGREEDGEQKSDGKQNQVASLGHSVNGDEADDGEKGQKSEEESEEIKAVNNEGDNGVDNDSQSKVLQSKVAENTKVEKEAVITMVTVQRDVSAKAVDLKPDVLGETELLKKSDDSKKGGAEKETYVSAEAKESVDETLARVSKESGESQGLSNAVQDEVHASERAEKTSDFSSLPVEKEELSGEAQAISSATDKGQETENSVAESKKISKSKAAQGEEKEAKSMQNAKHDSNKGQVKDSSIESNAKSFPEVEDEKPSSGDESQMVQSEMPKKTTATAEIKESREETQECSQVQKLKLSEVSEKTNDPQGKTEKLESIKSDK